MISSHLVGLKSSTSASMKNLYTLWMIPPPEIKKVLEDVIRELGDKYKGPYFEPHMTLLGNIPCSKEDAVEKTKILCKDTKPFEISLGEISFSTTYFQSVFVRIKCSASLMESNLKAKEVFKLENDLFMPHMSLICGDHQMKLRENIASEVKLPANLSFKVKKLVVTPCTNDPKDWIHLAEINLAFGS